MAANIPVPLFPRYSNLAPAGALIAVYEWVCGGHQSRCPEECSEADEVVVPRWGAFLREVQGVPVLGDPGSALFFHRAESYRIRHPVAGGDGGTVFRLAPGAAAELLAPHDPWALERPEVRFPVFRIPLEGRSWMLHRLARRAAHDPATPPLEVEERAVLFLRAVAAEAGRRSGRSHRASPAARNRLAPDYAARVAEVVAARYRQRLTLGDVAAAVGCSPFHLSRLVTAAAGVPIHRMILRRRLQDAVELLLETRDNISAIALAVGFASHGHLTDAFRREYGLPPSAVRRLREWGRRTGSRPASP